VGQRKKHFLSRATYVCITRPIESLTEEDTGFLFLLLKTVVDVLCMGIALLTPPVGIILFMISDMSEAPLLKVIKEVVPFLLVEIAVLAAVMYIPAISTWLPELLFN